MCHGDEKQKGGLRLDSFDAMNLGGDSGEPAIIPGDAAASLLYRAINGTHEDLSMPPKERGGGPLTPEQIATIKAWIDAGAWDAPAEKAAADAAIDPIQGKAPGEHWHWAYRPLRAPSVPTVSSAGWARSDIDRFVLAKLESMGLPPSPEAEPLTLLRRLSLDLIGLPPTIEEADAFIAAWNAADEPREREQTKARRDALYVRTVDRLLASPHYGERWALVWLDLARFADSHGYEKDGLRIMWPWRDWVIDALNRDVPFDQFTIEQLAGDELKSPTLRQRIATGFHRNTPINEEGGTDPEEFRVEAVLDRANTTASVWLGATMSCAQCHDHKFDPISQKEYFQFLAYFNKDEDDAKIVGPSEKRAAGPMVPAGAQDAMDTCESLWSERESLRARLQPDLRETSDEQAAWEAAARASADGLASPGFWALLTPTSAKALRGDGASVAIELAPQSDGSILATGENPPKAEYTLDLPWPAALAGKPITGLRLEVHPDPSTPTKFAGRSDNGNWVLSSLGVSRVGVDATEAPATLIAASADYWRDNIDPEKDWAPALAIDGHDDGRGWATHPRFDRPHVMVARLASPLEPREGATLRVRLGQKWGDKHTLARFTLSATGDASPAMPVPEHIKKLLAVDPDKRTPEDRRTLASHWALINPALDRERQRAREVDAEFARLAPARAMVLGKNHTPRVTHVFERGNFLTPGEPVEPGVPSVFASVAGTPDAPTRLGLARWLVDAKNPLTPRVHANRLWARLFGHALVETEEDFGTQGDPPTHPELLDHLATQFISSGWSQKQLLRSVVLSATYRQSSRAGADLREVDPSNKWLARGARFRLDAELVRDQALAASGLLSRKMFGPSVFPPQPEGIWTQIYSGDQWKESVGEDRHRRGLYTFIRRTSPYPTFSGMDAPSREVSCTRRPRTNTPLQALALMNDPQFVEAAGALAVRMLRASADDPARIEHGWRRCLTRTPTQAELARVLKLVGDERNRFQGDAKGAGELARACVVDRAGIEDHELAAWTIAASVLLNLDEIVTRE